MPSDLATALLSGQNAATLGADPALATITPQLQLAQALSTQALSAAPASPAQAGARLFQALAGVKVGHDAQKEFADMNTGATAEMGKIFPEGTPVGDGLRSQSGLVRMLAMQQAGKAMLLNSEGKTLGPEQTFVAPGTPRAGGAVMAAGSPAQAGAVENAKTPALVRRAGAEAEAKAPFEAGGNITIDTPRGREEIPATAATRAGMQPGRKATPAEAEAWAAANPPKFANPNGGPALPAPPQSVGPGGRVAGPAPYGYGPATPPGSVAPFKPAPAAPVAAVPPPAPAAALAPASSLGGQPVKTPEFQGDVKGREELYGSANKAIGGVIAEHIEAGGKASRDKLAALDTMESALRAGGDNIITGPHAEAIIKARETLDGMGIRTDWIKKGLPESEIVNKMNAQLASASAKAMTGRPTQAEFQIWMRNNPGLMTSKEGSLALMDVLRQQSNNDIELGKLAMKKGNWENWPEVADKFYQEHGLTNPITGKPMRDEIAAGRAGQGAPGGGAAPVKVSSPEDARKLPKGTRIVLPDGTPGVVP